MMLTFSRRDLDRIYAVLLLFIVALSWGYVIYASRITARWMLEERAAQMQQD